jgi:hypothetical protein
MYGLARHSNVDRLYVSNTNSTVAIANENHDKFKEKLRKVGKVQLLGSGEGTMEVESLKKLGGLNTGKATVVHELFRLKVQ